MSSNSSNSPSGSSGSQGVSHHHQRSHANAVPTTTTMTPAPPGFETFYMSEHSKVTNLFHAFILPLHWSLIRGGLCLRKNDSTNQIPSTTIPVTEITESLPLNWTSRITSKVEDGADQPMNVLILRYWDPSNSKVHYEAKIVEVVKNNVLVVILFKAINSYAADGTLQAGNKRDLNSHSSGRNSAAGNFVLTEYFTNFSLNILNGEGGGIENKAWFEVYKNLKTLETVVWEQLMDPTGISVNGRAKEPGPYESKTSTSENQPSQQQQQQQQQPMYAPTSQPPQPGPYPAGGIGGPLYVPPGVPAGTGGLGRSDLDPVGGFGTGMVADPRGFRQPVPFGGGNGVGPGSLLPPPPGARFDPFGPPMPNPRPPPGTGGGGTGNFATPNPDAEQPPPGFEDMFM